MIKQIHFTITALLEMNLHVKIYECYDRMCCTYQSTNKSAYVSSVHLLFEVKQIFKTGCSLRGNLQLKVLTSTTAVLVKAVLVLFKKKKGKRQDMSFVHICVQMFGGIYVSTFF